MLVEGVGLKAPAPVRVDIRPSEWRRLSEEANRRASFRGYGGRPDAWGRGFISNPILVGLLGEHAVCRYLNGKCGTSVAVDTALRMKGDGGRDLDVVGLAIQVKTRRKDSKHNLVRRLNDAKRILPLACDLFVFARLDGTAVELLGWIWAKDATEVARHVKSPVAGHFNLEISDSSLLPMLRLVDEVNARRLA